MCSKRRFITLVMFCSTHLLKATSQIANSNPAIQIPSSISPLLPRRWRPRTAQPPAGNRLLTNTTTNDETEARARNGAGFLLHQKHAATISGKQPTTPERGLCWPRSPSRFWLRAGMCEAVRNPARPTRTTRPDYATRTSAPDHEGDIACGSYYR